MDQSMLQFMNDLFKSQAQTVIINENKSPEILLSEMIENLIPAGMFKKNAQKQEIVEKYSNRRFLMIKNFALAKDPKIIEENFLHLQQKHEKYFEEQKNFAAIQENKSFVKSKMKVKRIELLQYQKIHSQELSIEQIHYNRYLELEVITENCVKGKAFHFLASDIGHSPELIKKQSDMTDPQNSVVNCKVSKLHDICDTRYFSLGRKFVVLDPNFSFGNDSMAFVKIENKDKLILLDNNQTFENVIEEVLNNQKAIDLKNLGNKKYSSQKYYAAINLYSFGISKALLEEEETQLLSALYGNRSQSYFNTKQYEKCLQDCEEALKLDPENKKFIFRRAKVIGFLNREEEALQMLKLLDPNNQDKEIQVAVALINDRLNQSSGTYNLSRLIEQVKDLNPIFDIEVKEFIGPIEIGFIEGKNRGIIAQKDIKKGQLILVEKAFSTNEKNQNFHLQLKMSLVNLTEYANVPLLRNTHFKIIEDPLSSQRLNYLFNGSNGSLQVSIQDLEKNNQHPQSFSQRITFFEMQKIIKLNGCNILTLQNELDMLKTNDYSKLEFKDALWVISSFFNHDCYGNCSRYSIGDVLFVVANRDIQEGEEITQQYMPLMCTYEERVKTTELAWEFRCQCSSCQTYKSLSEEAQIVIRSAFFKPNNKIKEEEKNEILTMLTLQLSYDNLQGKFLTDYYAMLFECLLTFSRLKDEYSFLTFWTIFQNFADLKEVSIIKMMVLRNFGTQSLSYLIVSQLYKELFMIRYLNDEEFFNKYG
eukprot:403366787